MVSAQKGEATRLKLVTDFLDYMRHILIAII